MFDYPDDADYDMRRATSCSSFQSLPTSVGLHKITKSPSVATPKETNASRNRSAASEMRKECTPVSMKDVDELKLTVRKLEGRLRALESRVQYVNPWAVQHMWDVLLKLQHRSGVPAGVGPQGGLSTVQGERGGEFDEGVAGMYRSCSPPSPNNACSSTSRTTQSVADFLEHDEWLTRSNIILDESSCRTFLFSSFTNITIRYAAALSGVALMERTVNNGAVARNEQPCEEAVWSHSDNEDEAHNDALSPMSPPTAMHLSPTTWAKRPPRDRIDTSPPFEQVHRRQPSPAVLERRPKLRSKFVQALLDDATLIERIRGIVVECVDPMMQSTNRRFVTDIEHMIKQHSANMHHEQHELFTRLERERDSMLQSLDRRIEVNQTDLARVMTETKSAVQDDLVVIHRLRDEVAEARATAKSQVQRMEGWREELLLSAQQTIQEKSHDVVEGLERLAEQQDWMKRQLDDARSSLILMREGAPDNDGGSSVTSCLLQEGAGVYLERAVAYLDGMVLAPSDSSETFAASRLSDSILLQELRNVLWGVHEGVVPHDNSRPICSFADIIRRPLNLFPLTFVRKAVLPYLLRHPIASLRHECRRLQLPPHVVKGLDVGISWLQSLGVAWCWRSMMQSSALQSFGVEVDDDQDLNSAPPPPQPMLLIQETKPHTSQTNNKRRALEASPRPSSLHTSPAQSSRQVVPPHRARSSSVGSHGGKPSHVSISHSESFCSDGEDALNIRIQELEDKVRQVEARRPTTESQRSLHDTSRRDSVENTLLRNANERLRSAQLKQSTHAPSFYTALAPSASSRSKKRAAEPDFSHLYNSNNKQRASDVESSRDVMRKLAFR